MSNDFYLKAIKSGIVNYTALANKIHKDVETITLSSVNIGTIIVAIKRFADELNKNDSYPQATSNNKDNGKSTELDEQKNHEPSTSPNDVRMSLTGSIIDINFNNDTIIKYISDIMHDFSKDTFFDYNLIHTAKKMCIFTEDIQESRKVILNLREKYNGNMTEGLSKITLTLPSENIILTRQILYHIFDMINNYKITLNNAFFTNREIILILRGSEAAKAYDLLRRKLFTEK